LFPFSGKNAYTRELLHPEFVKEKKIPLNRDTIAPFVFQGFSIFIPEKIYSKYRSDIYNMSN